jgi:hypothetical protein
MHFSVFSIESFLSPLWGLAHLFTGHPTACAGGLHSCADPRLGSPALPLCVRPVCSGRPFGAESGSMLFLLHPDVLYCFVSSNPAVRNWIRYDRIGRQEG